MRPARRSRKPAAQHGGRTAAFLAGDEGDGLISSLVEAGRREELPRAEAAAAAESPSGPDRDVLADLLKPEAPATAQAPATAAGAPAAEAPQRRSADVDLSVIEGLVDQPSRPTEPGKGSNP